MELRATCQGAQPCCSKEDLGFGPRGQLAFCSGRLLVGAPCRCGESTPVQTACSDFWLRSPHLGRAELAEGRQKRWARGCDRRPALPAGIWPRGAGQITQEAPCLSSFLAQTPLSRPKLHQTRWLSPCSSGTAKLTCSRPGAALFPPRDGIPCRRGPDGVCATAR